MKLKLLAPALMCAVASGLVLAPAAHAQFAVIDVKAIAQQIKQVQQAAQQLQQLQAQLKAQQQMLARLGTDISPQLNQIVNDATSVLRSTNGIGYSAKGLTSQLDQIYPSNLAGSSVAQIQTQQADWEARTRDSRREAMEAQNAVVQSQAATQQAVQGAGQASQNAQGQTAAAQATNQLLEAISSQLSVLQTLLVTQMRAAETANAEAAAKKAAAKALHEQNFGDPNTIPKYGNGY